MGHETKVRLEDLRIVCEGGKYRIDARGLPLRSPGGHVLEFVSPRVPERVIADFVGQGDLRLRDGIVLEPLVLGAYVLV